MRRELTDIIIASGILTIIHAGAFGMFGALVHYLFTIVKKDGTYSNQTLCYFLIMGLFVGVLAHYIMLDVFEKSYSGIVLVSGFLTMKVLDFLDINGLDILLKRK